MQDIAEADNQLRMAMQIIEQAVAEVQAAGGTPGHASGTAAGGTPGHASGTAAGGTPGHASGSAAGGTPGHASGSAAGGTPGHASGSAVGGTPGHASGSAAGGTPGHASGSAAGGTPGHASGTAAGGMTGAASSGQVGRSGEDAPANDLPEEIFRFVSRLTPLINVDLFIRDDQGRVLLTWRDDEFYGQGWHVPGGIIRNKETYERRIREVARIELGAEVEYDPQPMHVLQLIHPEWSDRGHLIPLVFACRLLSGPEPSRQHISGEPRRDQWRWFAHFPENMIAEHHCYRPYFA